MADRGKRAVIALPQAMRPAAVRGVRVGLSLGGYSAAGEPLVDLVGVEAQEVAPLDEGDAPFGDEGAGSFGLVSSSVSG